MDNTDLVHKSIDSKSIILDGPQTHKHTVDDGERCFWKDTNLQGNIFKLNTRGEVVAATVPDEYKQYIRALGEYSKCVGIILTEYTDGSTKEWWGGTGFRVSEDVLVSAEHVVKSEHRKEGRIFKLSKIFIYFGVIGNTDELPLGELGTLEGVYELSALDPKREVDSKFPDDIVFKIENCADFVWETKNDFTFLKFSSKKPSTTEVPIAYPLSSAELKSIPPTANWFVIGYPALISEPKFIEDYAQDIPKEEASKMYSNLRVAMGGFDRKVVSVGGSTPCNWLAYKCPTLRQTSGGFLGCFDAISDNTIRFAGVHIGGSKRMDNNFAVPVSMPAFQYSYKQFVDQNFN